MAQQYPATPAASADSSVAARSRTAVVRSPGRTSPGATTAPVSAMPASGREKSTGARAVSVDTRVPGREQEPSLAVAGARAEQQVRGGAAPAPGPSRR